MPSKACTIIQQHSTKSTKQGSINCIDVAEKPKISKRDTNRQANSTQENTQSGQAAGENFKIVLDQNNNFTQNM